MSTIARLAIIGLFGLSGIGFAVCLAMSSAVPTNAAIAGKPSRVNAAKEETAKKTSAAQAAYDTKHSRLQQPEAALLPTPSQAPQYTLPHPAFAQQPVPAMDPELLKKLLQLGEKLTNEPGGLNPSQLPAIPTHTPAQGPLTHPSQQPHPSQQVHPSQQPHPRPADALPGDGPELPPPARPVATQRPPRNEITRGMGEGDHNLSIHIQDTDIREVLDMLSEQGGLNILASNSVQGKVSASLNNVDIDTALAAILKSTGYVARHDGKFIFVGTPADVVTMEQSVDRIGTRIYRPNYVRAVDLQALISPLLTQGVGTISVSAPAAVGIAPDTGNTGGDSFAGGEAVLVRDYEAVLCQVDQVFEEIDKRPMQVAIEAMILSVKLSDKTSIGVDFLFLRDQNHIAFATGKPLSDLGQVSFENGGLKFGFLDSSLGAFLSALETIGDTNVIATPRLTCLNKHRAEILIGEKLGYLSTTQTETSTTQTVEFLEVGTQLRLRPYISSDGMIRMEVHPELSRGNVELEGNFTIPNKVVTEVTTNIMVADGRTVIIGGLMRENLDKTASQVPLLGSAPGIGFLFRNKTETVERDELIVLITPHIVYEPEAGMEGVKGACDFHRRQAVYADHMSPVGSRFLGRKYFRLAQDAWTRNDKRAALRFVNVALTFDPINRAAVELRSDIMADNHFGPHSGGPPQSFRPPGTEGELPPGPLPLHPWEPGQTGRVRNIQKPESMQ